MGFRGEAPTMASNQLKLKAVFNLQCRRRFAKTLGVFKFGLPDIPGFSRRKIMATTFRADRAAEAVRMAISRALRENIERPVTANVTITRVEMTHDLAYARVFFTVLGDDRRSHRRATRIRPRITFFAHQSSRSRCRCAACPTSDSISARAWKIKCAWKKFSPLCPNQERRIEPHRVKKAGNTRVFWPFC